MGHNKGFIIPNSHSIVNHLWATFWLDDVSFSARRYEQYEQMNSGQLPVVKAWRWPTEITEPLKRRGFPESNIARVQDTAIERFEQPRVRV